MAKKERQINYISAIRKEFQKIANAKKAKILAGFFKTGKGEYAQGDRFYGVATAQTRLIAKKYADKISFSGLQNMLKAGWHEERLCALLILVDWFKKAYQSRLTRSGQIKLKKIFEFYLANTKYINNWDLVDVTAYHIIGAYLTVKPKKTLERLACSKNLWERRIAIISTFHSIRQKDCRATLKIADLLLNDKQDLIHKAVGWMLREVGKRCGEKKLEQFLEWHCRKMPRIMLRYAIERFPAKKRKYYLSRCG